MNSGPALFWVDPSLTKHVSASPHFTALLELGRDMWLVLSTKVSRSDVCCRSLTFLRICSSFMRAFKGTKFELC